MTSQLGVQYLLNSMTYDPNLGHFFFSDNSFLLGKYCYVHLEILHAIFFQCPGRVWTSDCLILWYKMKYRTK